MRAESFEVIQGDALTAEREFLIRLAPIWLACRWRLFGGKLRGRHWPKADVGNDLLGMHDYAFEMKLLCEEVRSGFVR